MALIRCPECNKEISDKSKICINCGFPIQDYTNNKKPTKFYYLGVSSANDIMLFCSKCGRPSNHDRTKFSNITNDYAVINENIICPFCNRIAKIAEYVVTEQYEKQEQIMQQDIPHCPRCGSTSITTGARGVSGFWGFIGASKTVNRCANCRHTWTPKG